MPPVTEWIEHAQHIFCSCHEEQNSKINRWLSTLFQRGSGAFGPHSDRRIVSFVQEWTLTIRVDGSEYHHANAHFVFRFWAVSRKPACHWPIRRCGSDSRQVSSPHVGSVSIV